MFHSVPGVPRAKVERLAGPADHKSAANCSVKAGKTINFNQPKNGTR